MGSLSSFCAKIEPPSYKNPYKNNKMQEINVWQKFTPHTLQSIYWIYEQRFTLAVVIRWLKAQLPQNERKDQQQIDLDTHMKQRTEEAYISM